MSSMRSICAGSIWYPPMAAIVARPQVAATVVLKSGNSPRGAPTKPASDSDHEGDPDGAGLDLGG